MRGTFNVGRATMYRALHGHQDGSDCALVVYRNRQPKIDPDTNRRYGETNAGEAAQLEADRKWFPIAAARRRRLKAIVYVVDGVVTRVRAVDPDPGKWADDDRGYADIPVGTPLTDLGLTGKSRVTSARARQHPAQRSGAGFRVRRPGRG